MSFTVSLTMLAIVALVAGVAGLLAPRFLGIITAAGLCIFGVVQLFPEVRDLDLGATISSLDLDNIRLTNTDQPNS